MKWLVLTFLIVPFLYGADFVKVSSPFPKEKIHFEFPKVSPPTDSQSLIFDSYGNYLCLDSSRKNILVLPADQKKWILIPGGLPKKGKWEAIHADAQGYLWLVGKQNIFRLYPRDLKAGWEDFSSVVNSQTVECSAIGPHGDLMVGCGSEVLLISKKVDDKEARVESFKISSKPSVILTDEDGRIWAQTKEGIFRKGAPENAWQKHWKITTLLPCSNHDLSGDVLEGVFYTAGGLTNGYGFPAVSKTFDKVFAYEPKSNKIKTYDLGYDRIYCSVSHLDGKLWIINGDVKTGEARHATSTVQILDPSTGEVLNGPPTWTARPMPIALHVNGRIYVAGNPYRHYEKPGQLESIGRGEKQWRKEPDGPTNFQALAGTVLGDEIYLAVPKLGLAIFDTKTSQWTTVKMEKPPRSCQIAPYKGKIWMMGGVDVRRDSVQIYDPKTGIVSEGPDLPRNIGWGAGVNMNGKLYIFGGAESHRTYSNRVFVLRD